MRRRTFLGGIGLASIAGCVESNGDGSNDETKNGEEHSQEREEDEFDPDIESQYSRGGAEPVELEFEPHEPTFELTPEDHEYDESERTVHIEYPTGRSGEMDFEEFGRSRSRRAVVRDLRQRFEREELDNRAVTASHIPETHGGRLRQIELDIDFGAYDIIIEVSHTTMFDDNENIVYEPEISFEELVDLVPTRYDTETVFGGYEYSASIIVICHRSWGQGREE